MKLREYTRNTLIRRNALSKFREKKCHRYELFFNFRSRSTFFNFTKNKQQAKIVACK